MAYPDTETDFEHDPGLDFEDQNILAIESTDTLDNHLDNSDPTFDNIHYSSITDCTDIKQTVDNHDIEDPNESKNETIDDICKTKQITFTMKIKIILNLNPQKLYILTAIPKKSIAQLTTMTIIVQW